MTYPLQSNARPVNELVSRGLAAMINRSDSFIAEKLLPIDSIKGMIGDYAVMNERASTGVIQRASVDSFFGDASSDAAIDRSPGTNFHRSRGFGLSPLEFTARHFDGESAVPLEFLKDIQLGTSSEFDVKQAFLQTEMQTLLISLEKYVASVFLTAANWNGTSSPSTKWGASGDDPIANLGTAIDSVNAYGAPANTIVIPYSAQAKLRVSDGFREYMSVNTDRVSINKSRIAEVLISNLDGIEQVLFANARYNTGKVPGSASLSPVWGDSVWVGHLALNGHMGERNQLSLSPTAAARVVVDDWSVKEYEENQTDSLVMQIKSRQWAGVVNKELGYLLTSVTA